MATLCVSVFILLVSIERLSSITVLPSVSVENCVASGKRFLQSNFSCVACGPNERVSVDGLACECSHYAVPNTDGSCKMCLPGFVAGQDGATCVQCNSSLYDTESKDCPCNGRSQVIDDDITKKRRLCVECPTGTDSDGLRCSPCGLEDCSECVYSGGVCLSPTRNLIFPGLNEKFQYYRDFYPSLHYLCLDKNGTACQGLRNLCVLDQYSRGSLACQDVPDVYYDLTGNELLESPIIEETFVTKTFTQENGRIDIVLAAYALNGSFSGFLSGVNDLLLCHDPFAEAVGFWLVGVTYVHECKVNIKNLLSTADRMLFLSPYISISGQLYSIPVLQSDLVGEGGSLINMETDRSQWSLVKYFYLAESISSENTLSYASEMELRITPRGMGLIYPPFLRVSYERVSSSADSTNINFRFSILYESDVNAQIIGIFVSIGVLIVLGLIYSVFQIISFLNRSGRMFCEISTCLQLLASVCSILSSAILLVLALTSVIILLFYKSQSPLTLVLPTKDQELIYICSLSVATICKLVHVAIILGNQCTVDIFLIDWEKSKGKLITTNPPSATGTLTEDPNEKLKVAPVSIWRTYFVANEWNELQSCRRGFPLCVLFSSLLLLEVIGIKNIAAQEPFTHVVFAASEYEPPSSSVLRFALATMTYTFFSLLIWLYIVLFHERFVEHKLKQFADLCAIGNISVLILSHNKYGYYIHGKSVHGQADTDMKAINDFFKKEESNQVAERGLGDSYEQIFEISFTTNFRKYFNTILLSSQSESPEQSKTSHTLSSNQIKAYLHMNTFLSSFIDQVIPELPYVHQNKTLMEKILDFEIHQPEDRSILYARKETVFSKVLLFGQEVHLFIQDLLVFTVIDAAANNFTLAAVITYLVQWIVFIIRDYFGKRNVAKKTLVDKRFLI